MSNFTPTTNRCLVAGIILVSLVVGCGWAFGKIDPDNALLILLPTITGCFSLLTQTKGD